MHAVRAEAAPTAPLVTIDAIRAAAATLRGIAIRTPARPVRPPGGPSLPEGRVPPADRRVQDPRRLRRGRLAERRRARPVASSPTRPATTPRASRVPPGCSGRRRWSSCRPTRRSSSGRASRPMGRRSSSSGRRATSGSRSPRRSPPERGLAIIPPFDDDRIIAGQGTVGLEIVEDLPDVAAVLVPIGGGGLASGVAVAVKALSAGRAGDRRRIGARRRRAGLAPRGPDRPLAGRSSSSRTIADGTRTTALGERTFAHLSALLDGIVTVTEDEIAAGVRLAAEESRLVVEPSGALPIAAMVFHAAELGLGPAPDPGTGRRRRVRRERGPGSLPGPAGGADPVGRLSAAGAARARDRPPGPPRACPPRAAPTPAARPASPRVAGSPPVRRRRVGRPPPRAASRTPPSRTGSGTSR